MLKRIAPDQLRLGMYIQEIPGPWMSHPFWRGSFKLEKLGDLKTLQNGNIDKIVICTLKGDDIAELPTPITTIAPAQENKPVPARITVQISAEQERTTAARVLSSSK